MFLVSLLIILSACGGDSPTAPGGVSGIQAHLDRMTADIRIGGVTVPTGSTANATVGSQIAFTVTYTNNSGQVLHTGILYVRDDGVERLDQCGAGGSGGGSGSFGSSTMIFANDPFFARGRTVRMVLLGAYGPNVSGPGQCYLQLSQGVANHANVQAERVLLTIVVQ